MGCNWPEQADAESIGQVCVWLNECNLYSPHTETLITLKRFYQWLRAPSRTLCLEKKYLVEVEDLSTNLKHHEKVLPSDLLSENDTHQLLEKANRPTIRAFIALSDEVGRRIGESLGMLIKDIIFGSDVLCRLR